MIESIGTPSMMKCWKIVTNPGKGLQGRVFFPTFVVQ